MSNAADRVNAAFTLWDNTFDSGHVAALVALYTPDAWVLAPAGAFSGGAQLTGFFTQAFASGMTSHVLTPFDILDLGPTLVVSSKWQARIVKDGVVQAVVGGLASHVLQQEPDGSLKVRLHNFNTPPAAA